MGGHLAALAAALVAAVTTSPASASVRVGPHRLIVSTKRASAVVERDPFELRIEDASGAPVLSEVANAGQAPLPTPPTTDPIPPGYDSSGAPTLYAPLGFLVGSESIEQYDGLVWGGNLMRGERSGTQYSARAVTAVRRAGRGVRLTVSTSDPGGRTLSVRVAPVGPSAIGVSVRAEPSSGVAMLGDSFASSPSEAFFGFGGRHNALDQRGNTFSSWVDEENVDDIFGTGGGGDPGKSLFPNGPAAAYYPQAEFVSSSGYGFLLDQPQLARFQLADQNPSAWNVTASAPALRYVVAPGSPRRAIDTLTALTGRQPVPPRWALGPMLDRLVRNFGESQAAYEADVNADLRDIGRYRLPLTAYRIEGWTPPGPPSALSLPSQMSASAQAAAIRELRRRGIHPLVYLRPLVLPGSVPVAKGLVATDASGEPYYTTTTTGSRIALLDFTNPAAVRYWQREVRMGFDTGADGFMQDFGEEVLTGMRFHDGETGATMHNRYLVLYARATRQEIRRYERRHPHRRLWFFTRAGYTGRPGSAAYEGGNFPGDETTDWTHSSGLASLTPDMLNRAVGGAYGYGTDIGGYFDYSTPPTTKELFLRWAEWAALSPVFRLHGSGRSGTHTPWSFDAETVRVYKRLSRLHLRAVPLIMRLWRAAERTGIPPTRPLWLADPHDPRARAQDEEWLLGPNVLVAPVVAEGASSRNVYFPRGCWRAAGNGQTYRGPRSVAIEAPLTNLPYYLRCGTMPLAAR